MIRKLYTIVQSLKMQNNKCWSVLYKINKIIINLIYPITAKFNKRIGIDKDSKVIVSLTTHPTRIKTVWITIASLLSQTYKPAKVLLYLSNEQFSSGFNDLPKNLLRLQKRGLDIVLVDEDLKPHKKYFYSFKDYKDKLVITTDDDIFYPENMIEELVRASEKYPDAVICSRSHRIQLVDSDGNKQFAPYSTWNNNTTQEPEMLTLAVGCNGILYRPGLFDDELFNLEMIKETSLYTDDLWLKAMEIRSGIKTYNCSKEPLVFFDNIFTKSSGLWHVNAGGINNRNDLAWSNIIKAYPELYDKLEVK